MWRNHLRRWVFNGHISENAHLNLCHYRCKIKEFSFFFVMSRSLVIKFWVGILSQSRRNISTIICVTNQGSCKMWMSVFQSCPLLWAKTNPRLQNFKNFDRFFEEESKEQFKETQSGVYCSLLLSPSITCTSRGIKLPARHVQTHKYLHTLKCCFCTLCSFFQQGEFLSKCKAGDRCSSFLWK